MSHQYHEDPCPLAGHALGRESGAGKTSEGNGSRGAPGRLYPGPLATAMIPLPCNVAGKQKVSDFNHQESATFGVGLS